MPRLCSRCSNLHIEKSEITSIREKLKSDLAAVSHRLCDSKTSEPNFRTLQDLIDATAGAPNGKKCHFCLLLLQSLQGSDLKDKASLPNGPFFLELAFNGDGITIVAVSAEMRGEPLQLSLNTDDTCRGAEVSSSASSSQVISTINFWLDECKTHQRCSKVFQSWLPSRVIDVGSGNENEPPKLCETLGISGRYITLSHRWTMSTALSSTTLSNFDARKKNFGLSDLSQTFQDAIEVTRALKVRYLWIDSICIIQDSEEDWKRESSNMMTVYESAWLNIAAAGSSQDDGRLFMRRDQLLSRPCRFPSSFSSLSEGHIESSEGESYAFLDTRFFAREVFQGFLDRRGWILQERILSPRTIYFGRNELFWECSQHIASESILWGFENSLDLSPTKFNAMNGAPGAEDNLRSFFERRYHGADTFYHDFGKYPNNSVLEGTPTRSKSLLVYEYWARLVEEYSKKDLTNQSDKLRAIQGLAQALHKSRLPRKPFNECYYQGLWLDDLAHSLLWLSKLPDSQELAHAPSFSWASCSGSVNYVPSIITAATIGLNGFRSDDQDAISSTEVNWIDRVKFDSHLSYTDYTKAWKHVVHNGISVFKMRGPIRNISLTIDLTSAGFWPGIVEGVEYASIKERPGFTRIIDKFRMKDPATGQTILRNNSVVTHLKVLKTDGLVDNNKFRVVEMGLLIIPCSNGDAWSENWWGKDLRSMKCFRRIGIYKKILSGGYVSREHQFLDEDFILL